MATTQDRLTSVRYPSAYAEGIVTQADIPANASVPGTYRPAPGVQGGLYGGTYSPINEDSASQAARERSVYESALDRMRRFSSPGAIGTNLPPGISSYDVDRSTRVLRQLEFERARTRTDSITSSWQEFMASEHARAHFTPRMTFEEALDERLRQSLNELRDRHREAQASQTSTTIARLKEFGVDVMTPSDSGFYDKLHNALKNLAKQRRWDVVNELTSDDFAFCIFSPKGLLIVRLGTRQYAALCNMATTVWSMPYV